MLSTKKMSLFAAPRKSIIIHACNSQGMWGSGIAKPFAQNYPNSYEHYKRFCAELNGKRGTACGKATLSANFVAEDHWVGWIVTSHDYGSRKDDKETIKVNTTLALRDLCVQIYSWHNWDEHPVIDVYSNKFNSGLFGVPWDDSELILKTVLRDFQRINWIVCDPEL